MSVTELREPATDYEGRSIITKYPMMIKMGEQVVFQSTVSDTHILFGQEDTTYNSELILIDSPKLWKNEIFIFALRTSKRQESSHNIRVVTRQGAERPPHPGAGTDVFGAVPQDMWMIERRRVEVVVNLETPLVQMDTTEECWSRSKRQIDANGVYVEG
ncbi:hypothetical protein BDW22DRAFT_1483842 [Trametopsis cervina]|nr:hypothetical protein BDW22DRAFT_1483842 [Trametopsis cervina]